MGDANDKHVKVQGFMHLRTNSLQPLDIIMYYCAYDNNLEMIIKAKTIFLRNIKQLFIHPHTQMLHEKAVS